MRIVTRHPTDKLPKIERSIENDSRLSSFLTIDIEDALTARRAVEKSWNEARRQYSAIPKRPMRDVPVPNAPNIEIPLGAILSDDIYAQATDTLFTASPFVTVRPVSAKFVEHAKALQTWTNWISENEFGTRDAINNALLYDTQLGTGVYYIPFVEETKKDKVYNVTYRSPRILSHPLEDLIVPPGSMGDIQRDRWAALRFWYTKGELEERARTRGWDTFGMLPTAMFDLVRLQHERKANLRGAQLWREVFEVLEVYTYFDYDQDGMDEDLLVTWDRTSRRILSLEFNPYDNRPIEVMRYQRRPHLPYGIGIMEMVQPFQDEVTELHCYTMLNIYLANARVWAISEGAVNDTLEIVPGRHVKLQTDDVSKAIKEMKMSEVYPSAFQAQSMGQSLAERRIGTSGAAGMLAKGGSRTPGVTALSLLQQINRRFAPAFDDMREKTGAAIRQGIYRYRERLLAGDRQLEEHILEVMQDDANLVIEALKVDNFDKAVVVELTASSASVNREADRQNAILVANLGGQYYEKTVEIAMQAAGGQVPDSVRAVLLDVAKKGTELMDRTLRTFENVRDPKRFLVDMDPLEAAINDQTAQLQQQQVQQQVIQQLAGAAPGEQPPPLPAPGFSGVA